MPKESYTFKLDSELLKTLKQKAKTENRSFNNLVETQLKKSINKSQPSIYPIDAFPIMFLSKACASVTSLDTTKAFKGCFSSCPMDCAS